MYLQGKVKQVYPLQSGESPRGVWRKKEFVIETYAKVPKQVCLSIRGEAAATQNINVGDSLKVSLDIESKEHNGRWYTEARAWKIEPAIDEDNIQSQDTGSSEIDRTEDSF